MCVETEGDVRYLLYFIFGVWESHLSLEFANLASVACQLALGIHPLSLPLRNGYYSRPAFLPNVYVDINGL